VCAVVGCRSSVVRERIVLNRISLNSVSGGWKFWLRVNKRKENKIKEVCCAYRSTLSSSSIVNVSHHRQHQSSSSTTNVSHQLSSLTVFINGPCVQSPPRSAQIPILQSKATAQIPTLASMSRFITALHGMQTLRSSDENSVCPSVCLSHAWIVTKQ